MTFLPRLAFVLVAVLFAAHAGADIFHVSPNGDDANDGAEASPFKTLERALEAARARKPGEIVLRGGTYTLERPLVLDARDSGLVVRAHPGETPVLSGARRIEGWQPDADGRWKAPCAGPDFRRLYVDGRRAQRARGDCPEGVERYGSLEFIDADAGHLFPDPAIAGWRNPADIEFHYLVVWAHMICKVDSIERTDDGRARVHMQRPWFFLASKKEGVQAGLPTYIENAFELLDEPGEWYLDRAQHTVYYIPREGEDLRTANVTAPALVESLLRLEGSLDAPVQDVRFQGLTFADADWLRPSRVGHCDVQANFTCEPTNLYARDGWVCNVHNEQRKTPANVVLRAARGCAFEDCVFTRLGGAGLDIEHGSQDNRVQRCTFEDIAASGIQIGDVLAADHHPDDPRLVVRNNRIEDCVIRNVGADYKGSVGIFAGYTDGALIARNDIHDLPYSGISVGWGWGEPDAGGGAYAIPYKYETPTPAANNRIENNHIHRVMLEMTDGGGIYTLSNMPGTVISGNHLHHNGPGIPGGIYLDEGSGHIEITGNLVHDVATPMNYNNHRQDRIQTCNEHDNHFDVPPDSKDFPKEIAEAAGIGP
jgi:hypothetical protein